MPKTATKKKTAKPAAKKRPGKELIGGKAAREGKGPLWKFLPSNDGSFVLPDPDYVSRLYFPLFNMAGMKSYVTPEMKGDVCTNFDTYLTIPKVTEDFHLSRDARNFWVHVPGKQPWSAVGESAFSKANKWDSGEDASVEAGIGWFQTSRKAKKLGLTARTTAFVPANDDMVELMLVEIENTGRKPVKMTCTAASPIFGRSADNVRDHRQVTSMFNEVTVGKYGVSVKPRIHHDEKGHRPSDMHYSIFACTERGSAPTDVWSNLSAFIGEGGTLDNPEAVFKDLKAPKPSQVLTDGVESVSATRFTAANLAPGKSAAYIVMRAISNDPKEIEAWRKKYDSKAKVIAALEQTRAFWKELSDEVHTETGQSDVDNLFRWIAFQPFCRKIYGNSYLPDHDYGRGGRGWRDLWSDMLGLFLVDPAGTREDIINNLHGIRVDGSNATIIGHKPGEFVADRNNIVRSWSDHGTWPFFILKFYIDHSGDFEVLLKDITYWKDKFTHRSKLLDEEWNEEQGNHQRNATGEVYKGSILEHILVQILSSFYHVGEHNNILLEGGDWNDTYDMGRHKGESVCFYNWYGWNLRTLAEVLETLNAKGIKEVPVLSEVAVLLDTLAGQWKVNYGSPSEKQRRLKEYFGRVRHTVSGNRVFLPTAEIAADLRKKALHIYEHIRKNEYLTTKDDLSFFNGHYDDHSRRVHGDHPLGVRIDLTSQVLPILFGVATDEQVAQAHKAVMKYLRNAKTGGLRLCSDFKELKLDFGRVTGFVYGWREHGSLWMQQNVMYTYALYCRGFVKEAYRIFTEINKLCLDSATANCFPNMPSTFQVTGKGLSSYLTGAATWHVIIVVSQMFGVRGVNGDLLLNPKLTKEQFDDEENATIYCNFLKHRLKVTYRNPKHRDWNKYTITAASINGTPVEQQETDEGPMLTVDQDKYLQLCKKDKSAINEIVVDLA